MSTGDTATIHFFGAAWICCCIRTHAGSPRVLHLFGRMCEKLMESIAERQETQRNPIAPTISRHLSPPTSIFRAERKRMMAIRSPSKGQVLLLRLATPQGVAPCKPPSASSRFTTTCSLHGAPLRRRKNFSPAHRKHPRSARKRQPKAATQGAARH